MTFNVRCRFESGLWHKVKNQLNQQNYEQRRVSAKDAGTARRAAGQRKKNREILDTLNKEHVERQRNENDFYKEVVNKQRDEHTARQHDIERRMNDLKMEWAREHPIEEVKVIE